jgi:hypothetical protein
MVKNQFDHGGEFHYFPMLNATGGISSSTGFELWVKGVKE